MNAFLKTVTKLLYCIGVIICLHFMRRIIVAERFVVPSFSMAPTLVPGDHIWVNKLLMGARIYKSFDFEHDRKLKCFRIPGIRDIRVGDLIVFNYPYGYDNLTKIEFKINYVYCKRVVGCPGDRIGVVDAHCWNDSYNKPIGIVSNQEFLRWMNDSILRQMGSFTTIPYNPELKWNVKNMGPIVVPKKGMTILIDDTNIDVYRQVIKYESGIVPDGEFEYTFKQNWYWGMGDNSAFSYDSRFWGFIPEDFIIGIVGGKKVRNNPYQTYQLEQNDDHSDGQIQLSEKK